MSYVRINMYKDIQEYLNNTEDNLDVLVLGGETPISGMISNPNKVLTTDIPEVDAHALPYEDDTWDIIISDQMLEHVQKPWLVVEEMWRVLKSGGLVICTSCSYNPVHWGPLDCYRFMPDGFDVLFDKFNNRSIKTWGNKAAIIHDLISDGHRHTLPKSVSNQYLETNDINNPWVIWVIGQK